MKNSKAKLTAAQEREQKAEQLAAAWLTAKQAKEKAETELSAATEGLKQFAHQHREAYFPDSSNTARFAGVKVAIVTETKYKAPADFDYQNFGIRFPKALKIDLATSVVKGLMNDEVAARAIEDFGVTVEQSQKVTIDKDK